MAPENEPYKEGPLSPRKKPSPDTMIGHEQLQEIRRAFIAELLHDIGTPLHVIGGRASLLKRKLPDSEVAVRNLTIIQHEVEKIIAILQKYGDRQEELSPDGMSEVSAKE